MCYAIPARILRINGDEATVDYGGVRKKANISLLGGAKVGGYILIHAGFAIEKLDRQSAEESLRIIRDFMRESGKGLRK